MSSRILDDLKKSGYRITPIRKKLIILLQNSRHPVSVSDILLNIKANKTTIYREIQILLNASELTQIDFADGTKRYELSGQRHHHHLVCIRCRGVQDVTLKESLFDEEIKIAKVNKFKILKHNLEFFGYCQKCI